MYLLFLHVYSSFTILLGPLHLCSGKICSDMDSTYCYTHFLISYCSETKYTPVHSYRHGCALPLKVHRCLSMLWHASKCINIYGANKDCEQYMTMDNYRLQTIFNAHHRLPGGCSINHLPHLPLVRFVKGSNSLNQWLYQEYVPSNIQMK